MAARRFPAGVAGCTLYTSCEPCLLCSFGITRIGLARIVFAARGTDVPGYRPLLGGDFAMVADWVNAQPGWPPLQVAGGLLRERAVATIHAYPWGAGD
ncbi:MAG TPA: hypothetical protein VK926_04300 [Gaiellaceae bacterium]|nr:hypothetical protein [Gaiellaceae bacterium]